MGQGIPAFLEPNALERLFNKAFGVVVGWGLGPRDYYLLEVRGRRTGRVYATPVNVVELGGKRFLVAPHRGQIPAVPVMRNRVTRLELNREPILTLGLLPVVIRRKGL